MTQKEDIIRLVESIDDVRYREDPDDSIIWLFLSDNDSLVYSRQIDELIELSDGFTVGSADGIANSCAIITVFYSESEN